MSPDASLKGLAEFLRAQREEITTRWVEAVRTDPAIASSTKLPHEQLMDHLPLVFNDLADTLRGANMKAGAAEHAPAHGEHRWWQGFQFTELLREMSILRRIISVDALADFAMQSSTFTAEVRRHAETVVHTFFDRIFTESARQFVSKTEEERSNFRALFESTTGAYAVVKAQDGFEVVAASDAYLNSVSLPREALIGRKLFDVFPELPGDASGHTIGNLEASFQQVLATRAADALPPQRYPIQLSVAEGGGVEERYWSCVNAPVFGPGGEITFIVNRAEDVTAVVQAQGTSEEGIKLPQGHSAHLEAEIVRRTQELVRSNQQLRRGEERFKLAVGIAQMGTFEIDLRTDGVVVNDEARVIYGWAPDAQLTFSKVQTQFHPDDREHVLRVVRRAFDPATQSDEFDVEQRIFRTDGTKRWIRVRARAFFEGEGSERVAVTCVGTFLDITERKEHETALRDSESRFRQLADSIPQLAWMAKPDGWIFWYNRRWHEFTGTTAEQMEGWGWQSVHDPKELPRIVANWTAALAKGESWEDTFPLRRADGEFRVHLSRANPFRDSAGNIVLWFGTNTDITELARAEEAASAANRAKDHFIATLSHELRTPLTPVLATIVDLSTRLDLPPAIGEAMELIRRNVELEARLIDDLLDVTRISKGKLRMDREVVALHSVLHDAKRICENDILKKGVTVGFDLQAPNNHVQGDAPRLLQAFWNLLQNAVKFTPSGGEIMVRTRAERAGRLRVEIADNGIGIEPAALARIFNAFDQADDSISRRFGGLGLGLSLSKALVEAHGGRIAATSSGRDRGTTFSVELDTTEARARIRSSEPVQSGTTTQPLRILLVEDHEDTRRTLARLIQKWGHSVATGSSISQGLQLATQQKFDLLVSDLGLPDGHGTDLMRELRKTSDIAGIAVSGFGTDDDVSRSLAAGFQVHLAKPIGAQKLKAAIEEMAAAQVEGVN